MNLASYPWKYCYYFLELQIHFPFWVFDSLGSAANGRQKRIATVFLLFLLHFDLSAFLCFTFFSCRILRDSKIWRFSLVWEENEDGYSKYYIGFLWFWNGNFNWACDWILHVCLLPANWCQGRLLFPFLFSYFGSSWLHLAELRILTEIQAHSAIDIACCLSQCVCHRCRKQQKKPRAV